MSEKSQLVEPKIIEFGPRRIIGIRQIGSSQNNQGFGELWEKHLLPRQAEIEKPNGISEGFGVCRCLPGATDGSFEYIAAFAATEDAPVPEGMMAFDIHHCTYAAFGAESLATLGQAWDSAMRWGGESTEWDTYCGPKGCDCVTYPSFEFYPPEFDGEGPLFVYVPVKQK